MPFLEQLVQSIDGRIREVTDEIASLQAARSALLANGSAPTTQTAPRAAPRRSRRAKSRRTRSAKATVQLAEAAERILAGTDGLTTAALAKQAEADRDQVLALLRDLEAARRVRRTGQRRGTRWHAVTDEDRIRTRAAELAARSKRRAT